MANPSEEFLSRATKYANARVIELKQQLGFGKDGVVYSTDAPSAIKVFGSPETFERELACYERLEEIGVHEILGHAIPKLVDANRNLLAIEMSVVDRPFLLDFASVYLDVPPEFSEEVVEEWERAKQEEFGHHWGEVVVLLDVLREQYGIYLLDVHPGNIAFEEEAGRSAGPGARNDE